MKNEVVLEVNNLSKRFKVYSSSWGRIKEWLTFGSRSYHKDFWSLKGVSFKLNKGEFLGIIGPNGAGKSTLLKVITGVLDATGGSYRTTGKVLSLLELSGGLDNALTGRENIIRTSHLLGFPDSYIGDRMEQIADFAELGDFFDRPLGTYSSGMRIRLAFSMFAFLDCDILILDEVLAVGDIFFKQKCYARLEQLIERNTAILFVTQSTGVVSHYCDSVILMNKGEIVYHGAADQAVQKYFQIKNLDSRLKAGDTFIEEDYLSSAEIQNLPQKSEWPSDALFANSLIRKPDLQTGPSVTQLLLCDEKGVPKQVFRQGEKAYFYFSHQIRENAGVPVPEINLTTEKNLVVHGKNSLQYHAKVPLRVRKNDTLRVRQVIKLDIRPGNYVFDINLYSIHPADYARLNTMTPSEFKEKRAVILQIKPAGIITIVPAEDDRATGVHNGLCNLDGELSVSILAGVPETDMSEVAKI
ncbi:MAG: ABC transporter ATP-binding protein [Chloroflexi bacterium]|nr:ABC transporter ATP-binding protein [Chloroflexota bacterium]